MWMHCAVCGLDGKLHRVRGGRVNGKIGYVPLCTKCWDKLPPSARNVLKKHYEPFPACTGIEFLKWAETITLGSFETGVGCRAIKERFDVMVRELGGTPELLSEEYLTKMKNKRRQRELIRMVNTSDLSVDPAVGVGLLEAAGVRACSCCLNEFEVGVDNYGRPWCGLCAVLTARYGYCALHGGPVIDPEQKALMEIEDPFDRDNIDPDLVPPSMLIRYGLKHLLKKREEPLQSESEIE